MPNYKIGQKVKVVKCLHCTASHVGKLGDITAIHHDGTYEVSFDYGKCYTTELSRATPSWDNLQVGDIVIGQGGARAKVLDVFTNTFVISDWGEFDIAGHIYTAKEAKKEGWKLEGSEDSDITELSVKEVAEKLNIDPSKLKIVDK